MLGGAGKMAGHVGTGGVSGTGVGNASQNKQSASTSEGGIDIAAAIAVNVQTIKAIARIDDGVTVFAGVDDTQSGDDEDSEEEDSEEEDSETVESGSVTVISKALNENSIVANGSASNGKIGVGVAVAINVVNYDNIAEIGDACVEADALKINAGVIGDDPDTNTAEDKEAADASQGWLMDMLNNAITDLMVDVADSLGLADLFGESSAQELATILTSALGDALDTLLQGTGLEDLLKNNPYEKIQENLANLKALFLGFPDKVKDGVLAYLGEDLTSGEWAGVKSLWSII